jgi:DNA-directed RNA polymerase specialized sigma24 family protein
MPTDPKQKARDDAKRAQAMYERAKDKLDQAGEERRASFESAKAAGLSLAEIGQAADLHRSRVDQILKRK